MSDSGSDSFDRLAAAGRTIAYRPNTILIQQGDHGDSLFLIRSGRVRVFVSEDGDRELTMGEYGPGETVGEMSLDGGPRSASVITITQTVCSIIDRPVLLAHIAEHPEFAMDLLARVISRARLATESARSIALLDVYSRVSRLLEALAVSGPNGQRDIPRRLTHQAIANQVGASREMVSKILKELEKGGFVQTGGQRIALLKPLPKTW